MKSVYAVLLLGCAMHLSAQSMPTLTRVSFAEPGFAPSADLMEAPLPRANFISDGRVAPQGKLSSFNRPFAVLAAISAAAMVADIELTANCVRTAGSCREANPLLGSDPRRARMYGLNVPIYMSEILLSRMLKRKLPERKLWMMPLLSLTSTHAIGAASNMWTH